MKAAHSLEAGVSGQRLDIFLSENLDISRSQARRLIDENRVSVDAVCPKAGYRLKKSQIVKVSRPFRELKRPKAEAIPLKIIHQDEDLLVIDKPAGLVVHPGAGHPGGTLADAVAPYVDSYPDGTFERAGIVHRLDKNTSGLMVVARNAAAHAFLAEQFKSRKVQKTYIALVEGIVKPARGYIEAPIGRHRTDRVRMAVTPEGKGRTARTGYRVIEYPNGQFSLLEIHPETGRTHQIRVHFATISHPVAGDVTYGARPGVLGRQFLHAQRLVFKMPHSLRELEFTSDLPQDLESFLRTLRQPRTAPPGML